MKGLCTIKIHPEHLWADAKAAAIAENPLNKVLFKPKPQRGAMQISKKWSPGRTINVAFLDGSSKMRQRVQPYFHEWEQYVNLKFQFIIDPKAADARISFYADDGSWSYLGTDALVASKSEPTMNFGWLRDDTEEEEYGRVVRHEVGHLIGFEHELQQPAANVQWDVNKVLAYYMGPPNNWSKQDVYDQVLNKLLPPGQDFTAFDPVSIMAYPVPADFTINHIAVPMNTVLSDMDKAFGRHSYPFDNTVPVSVPVLGFGEYQYNKINDLTPINIYKYIVTTPGVYRIWSSYMGATITLAPVADQTNPIAHGIQQFEARLPAGEYRLAVHQRQPGEVANYRIISRKIG